MARRGRGYKVGCLGWAIGMWQVDGLRVLGEVHMAILQMGRLEMEDASLAWLQGRRRERGIGPGGSELCVLYSRSKAGWVRFTPRARPVCSSFRPGVGLEWGLRTAIGSWVVVRAWEGGQVSLFADGMVINPANSWDGLLLVCCSFWHLPIGGNFLRPCVHRAVAVKLYLRGFLPLFSS